MMKKMMGGFLLSIFTLLGGAATVGATSTVQIQENPNSPQSITIQRTIEGVTNPVSATITYGVVPDDSNPAPTAGYFASVDLVFNAAMPDENHSVTQTTQLDMSTVAFSQVGDYKFKIKEIRSSNTYTYPIDEDHEYYVYAYVRNEIVNSRPTGNIVATLVTQVEDCESGEKTDATFGNSAAFAYVQISKEVAGNAARTDEYFRFHVSMNGAPAGDRYVITGQDETIVYNGETITTQNELVAGQEAVIYLKHGQTAYIGISGNLYQIQHMTGFRYSEDVPDGYTVKVNGRNANSGSSAALLIGDDGVLLESNKVLFINRKEAAALTGVSTTVIPIVLLAVISIGGFVIARKLRNEK